MSYPVYPDTLPLPQLAGYHQRHVNNHVRTRMGTGLSRQRAITTARFFEDTASFVFSPNEYAVFDGFVVHTLSNGNSWFYLTIETPLGVKQQLVKLNMPYDSAEKIGLDWRVSFTVLIKDRAKLTDDETNSLAVEGPDSIDRALESLTEVFK